MARTKKPPSEERPKPAIHTVTLTPDVLEALRQLSSDASDFIGRVISNSAVIRALVRQAAKQERAALKSLFSEIEEELQTGLRWGKKT